MASSSRPIESEPQQNSAPTPTANVDSSNATDENPPSKKQKKLKSDVWNHFDRTQTIEVVNGKRITNITATCKVCSKTFEANSKHGTTRLRNHYTGKHGVPTGQGLISSVGETFKYDEESSRKKLALAVVMHEYPFRIVEHEYFVDFVKSLCPSFQMKSRTTCRKEILEMFKEERGKVFKFLGSLSCRLSSTMDLWTSRQNKSYMCVTVHFIDEKWNMQKKIISFMRLRGRHTGANLCQAVMKILFDWNIDKKMFSLTLDNDSANGVCVREMVERLNKIGGICCGGKLFHVRCAAHIMNLVVQDGINVIRKGIDNIREVVGKVKHSPILREEFEKRASDCKLDIGRALSLDVSTRWNSTYMMLKDAIYYRDAFERMYILNNAWFPKFPSSEEWQGANELCKILKNFHAVTEILSGTSYPTSNLFFAKFCDIKLRIGDWLRKENPTIVEMASLMKEKFDKYWDQSNIVLAIASFLDPRYKMGLIEFYYPKIYQNKGVVELEEFNRVLKELYGEYALKYQSVEEVAQDGGGSVPGGDMSDGDEDMGNELNQFMLERSQPWNSKSDLDRYLERRPTSCPQGQDFNVLNWWKLEGKDYQILSKLAQDVLAIPVSTVASESTFSTGGRVINAYRSKLDFEIVEALVCIQDWIRGDKKDCAASIFDSMEETEEEEEDGDDNSD